jgi:hypothetical protein
MEKADIVQSVFRRSFYSPLDYRKGIIDPDKMFAGILDSFFHEEFPFTAATFDDKLFLFNERKQLVRRFLFSRCKDIMIPLVPGKLDGP